MPLYNDDGSVFKLQQGEEIGNCKLMDEGISLSDIDFKTCKEFFKDDHNISNNMLLILKRKDLFIKKGTPCQITIVSKSTFHWLLSKFDLERRKNEIISYSSIAHLGMDRSRILCAKLNKYHNSDGFFRTDESDINETACFGGWTKCDKCSHAIAEDNHRALRSLLCTYCADYVFESRLITPYTEHYVPTDEILAILKSPNINALLCRDCQVFRRTLLEEINQKVDNLETLIKGLIEDLAKK